MDSDEMASCDAVNDCVAQVERNEIEEAGRILDGVEAEIQPVIECEEILGDEELREDSMADNQEPESQTEEIRSKICRPAQRIECSKCQSESSTYWRTSNDGTLICNSCSAAAGSRSKGDCDDNVSQGGSDSPASVENDEMEDGPEQDEPHAQRAPSPRKREVRKATRMKTAKSVKSLVKSRRTVTFKKTVPKKTTPSVAHFITSKYVRHRGSYLQSGDVVSMLGDDNEIYYAQLRTFLIDQFGEISATISWLIPTERSPADGSFDAASFVIGPEEDFPREIRCMSFECNAPSDYYLARSRPIVCDERRGCKGFVWTSLGRPEAIKE